MMAPAQQADEVLALALARPPTLGAGRLIAVDGPAGSGKTTLAGALAARGAAVVHVDDLLPGWDGLPRLPEIVAALLGPLAAGRPGRYRRYDWIAGAPAEGVDVLPAPLLVLEGVGAGGSTWAELVTVLVWVEAASGIRLERGLARDGEALRARWLTWMREEDALFAHERTRQRADLVYVTGEEPAGTSPR